MTRPADPNASMRWMARGIAAGILLVGWTFVLWQNRFHVTTPVVMVCLAYLAVVAIVFNMYRTGASAVAENAEDDGGASWGLPIGARGELEREKKTLLKAIKEAEFDQMMGKLSKQDAEDMIRTIRARAIEVIKELDNLDAGNAGSVRDRIEREVRARLVVASAVDKTAAVAEKKVASGVKSEAKPDDNKPDVRGKKRGKNRGRIDDKATDDSKAEAKSDSKADSKNDARAESTLAAAPDAKGDSVAATNADTKPDATIDSTIDSKAVANVDAKNDSKAEAKNDSKAVTNSDSNAATNIEAHDSKAQVESKVHSSSDAKSNDDGEDVAAPSPGDDVKREEVRS